MYVDEAHIKRERRKARELRMTSWWKALVRKGLCYYCQKKSDEITMDHKVPLSLGGVSSRNNIVPCCKTCNTLKGQQLDIDWKKNGEE